MLENIGGGEILLILIVILVFFGPKKIPELAASLGKGLRKFNEAKDGFESQIKTVMKEPLDAINDAKAGFEAKVMEASQPLREAMIPPSSMNIANAGPTTSAPVASVTPVVATAPVQVEVVTTPQPVPSAQVPVHEA
jgi:sec-independent protein translocase protein TatA